MEHEPTDGAVLGAIVCDDESGPDVVQILDHKFDNPKWKLPVGGIKPGESELEALAHETHEETGLDMGVCYFWGFFILLRKDKDIFIKKIGQEPVREGSEAQLHQYQIKVPRTDADTINGRTRIHEDEHIYCRVVKLVRAMNMGGMLAKHRPILHRVWDNLQRCRKAA